MGPWSPTSLLGGHLLLGLTTGIPLALARRSGFWQLALALACRSGFWQLALATGLTNGLNKVFWGTTQHSHCLWPIRLRTNFHIYRHLHLHHFYYHFRVVTIWKSPSERVVMCCRSSVSFRRVWIWESLVCSARVWIHRCHHLNQRCVDTTEC